ncbi:MAG TPA: heparin lyase I family protein [Solirubrobacterales bacterium]|nr:heparin lyase I family protein [Solirubrobacterales bacterium]
MARPSKAPVVTADSVKAPTTANEKPKIIGAVRRIVSEIAFAAPPEFVPAQPPAEGPPVEVPAPEVPAPEPPGLEEPAPEEPPVEEPAPEEPPVEEPAPEEPPVEEPPAEEPPVEEPAPEEPPVEEPAPEEPPVEEPAPEEPPVEEPAPEEPAPEEPSPEPPPPAPLFASGLESPEFNGWHLQALPGRVTLSSTDPFQGTANARFEVREGDVEPETGSNRAEVSGPTFNEGQDIYVRDAIRVPSANTFEGSWQIIQQLHETDWGGSPGIAVFLEANRGLKIVAGDGSPSFWQGPVLQPNRWYDLVYRVNLSQNSAVGFVEVWLDGVRQTVAGGGTRVYGKTIQTAHTYLKAGIYRGSSSNGTSVVEHDNIVVGTSLASVMGG